MKKYYKIDDSIKKVAVLISPGWGGGWFSWNREYPEIIFDSNIVEMLEDNKYNEIVDYCEKKYPDGYFGGVDDLIIVWLPEGTKFRIEEFDGSEYIITEDRLNIVA